MTLSASIFPSLPVPAISPDFNRVELSQNGSLPGGIQGMAAHAELLRRRLARDDRWNTAGRRLAIGHSFGGMLLLDWLCSENGDSPIDGMVLISTTAGPMYDAVRVRLGSIGTRDVRVPFAPLLPFWNHPIVTRLAKRVFTGGRLTAEPVDFRRLEARSDFAVDAAGWRNTDWRAMRSYRLAMKGFDVRDRIGLLDIPAVVLQGSRDTLFPLEVGRALADGLPRARFRVVEGAGHALPLTHGKAVLEALGEIMGAAGSRQPAAGS